MKKIIFWGLPILLSLAIFWINSLRSWPHSDAEVWLNQQMTLVSHMDVDYGGGSPGSIQKHISISDPNSMRRIISSVRCRGSLTNTKIAKPDDGLLGYNECYNITFSLRSSRPALERIWIGPSNDRTGIYFVTRSDENGIIGWAEMNSTAFENFKATLRSVPGRRSAGY